MNVQFEIYIFMLLTVCLSTLLIINIQTELFQNLVRLAVPNPLKNVSRFVRFRLRQIDVFHHSDCFEHDEFVLWLLVVKVSENPVF